MPTTIDDLITAVQEEDTLIDSVSTLVTGLKTRLDEALKGAITPEVQAKIDGVFASIQADKQKLSDAIVAGTPNA